MRKLRMSLYSTSAIVICCLALTACGGGSPSRTVSVPTSTTTLPPPVPSSQTAADFETAEYNTDWSLNAIKASEAYARGFTGKGAIIGMVDFGFELNNSEINWHPLSQGPVQRWVDMYEDYLGVEVTESHHGHWVSSIAAGKKNNLATQGVAFDAEVLAIDFFAGVARHTEFSNGVTYTVSDPWGYVVNNGARVVNKSIGYDEEDFITNPPARSGNAHYTTTNAARVVELGGLLVAAAGNDGDPDPMVSNIDTLDLINQNNLWASGGYFLVAGSLNEFGSISYFSDRAGILKDYYLVAPGENISVSASEFGASGYGAGGNGTSFAAPHIVGAAALLFGQWPQLSAADVAEILLTSATDLGAPGVDAIYGHGLLNLDEATKPSGQTTVAVKSSALPTTLEGGMIVMGQAFGDASPQNLADVMVLDRFDRDFYIDARESVLQAATGLNFDSILDQRRTPHGGAFNMNTSVQGYLALDNRALTTSRPEIFLTEQEKLDLKPSLQAWHLTGQWAVNTNWAAGQGYRLSQALDLVTNSRAPDQNLFLTGQDTESTRPSGNLFFASARSLDDRNNLSLAVSTAKEGGQPNHNLVAYHEDIRRQGVETRLSHHFESGQVSLGLGALWEQNALMGSRSTSGLKLADKTVTTHLSLQGKLRLGGDWTLVARAEGGLSNVTTATASLFEKFNRFTSSQWQASLITNDLFASGDQFGVTISQPRRVENARVQVTRAVSYNLDAMAPDFTTEWLDLSPSGREIALEAGYAHRTDNWSLSANVIQRFNAGHRAGESDSALLLHARTSF